MCLDVVRQTSLQSSAVPKSHVSSLIFSLMQDLYAIDQSRSRPTRVATCCITALFFVFFFVSFLFLKSEIKRVAFTCSLAGVRGSERPRALR